MRRAKSRGERICRALEKGPATLAELAARLGRHRVWVSVDLSRLEDDGLVTSDWRAADACWEYRLTTDAERAEHARQQAEKEARLRRGNGFRDKGGA